MSTREKVEIKKLKAWYDSVMDGITKGQYYKCGTCGGPVSVGLCCAWCKTTDPVTLKNGNPMTLREMLSIPVAYIAIFFRWLADCIAGDFERGEE